MAGHSPVTMKTMRRVRRQSAHCMQPNNQSTYREHVASRIFRRGGDGAKEIWGNSLRRKMIAVKSGVCYRILEGRHNYLGQLVPGP